MAAANANNVAVMGIRAVQAGALTDALDRPLPDGHSELADYARAAPFRAIAAEIGKSAAYLAHQYRRAIHRRRIDRRKASGLKTGASSNEDRMYRRQKPPLPWPPPSWTA